MTAGAQLKQARTAKNLTFADVTRQTRIQAWVLEAMEADQLHKQMSPIYAKGFLSQYAKHLGVDPAPLVAQMQAMIAPPPAPKPELPPAAPAVKMALPKVELPKVELPKVELPKFQAPKIEVPKFQAPKIELPKFKAPTLPKVELPKLVMPRVQLPKVTIPKIKLPKVEVPRFEMPKVQIPWDRIRRAAPAFAVAAVVVGIIAINPAKQFAKIEWPKVSMPKIAFKMPKVELPKFAFKLPSLPKQTAKAPAPKKIAKAKPESKSIVVARKPAAAKPATEAGAPRSARGADGSAPAGARPVPASSAIPDELARVPAPQLAVAPRTASVAPTVNKPKTAALPVLELAAAQPLELVLITTRATFVQVRADGKLLASRQLPRGSKERWTAKSALELVVANPTDVDLKLNGQSIAPFAVAYRGRMKITHRGVVQLAAAASQ